MSAVERYVSGLKQGLSLGLTTEASHRSLLQALVESIRPNILAVNEPKRSAYGAPDFVILDSRPTIARRIGYIETKDVGISLDEVENTEQLKRYRAALENLILTDYLEFRWYVRGNLRLQCSLGEYERRGALTLQRGGQDQVVRLLEAFLSQEPEEISTAEELANRLALTTHLVRDSVISSFRDNSASDLLRSIRQGFATTLLPGIDEPANDSEFADMFAQTLAYGLFTARVGHDPSSGPFRRQDAASEIPRFAPFLRRIFHEITGPDLDVEPYSVFVDDLVDILNHTRMVDVLTGFGASTRTEDPVVHFYETFLKAYDPELRQMRGVYFTPWPVVSYLVRSTDSILKSEFGCPAGIGSTEKVANPGPQGSATRANGARSDRSESHRVLILDPACGTGTFLYAAIELIRKTFERSDNAGLWSSYVRENLLPRLFGFELLMAPYTVAHVKLGMELAALDLPPADRREWAVNLDPENRVQVYLTNSLKPAETTKQGYFDPFMRALTEEAASAARVKRELPILVVIGNPPYSGVSANKDPWIVSLVHDYYTVDGKPLGEKNPKWLLDDYVKFLRFAEWRIDRTGSGIVAFVTNHSYLDNPTFRGMRSHLMKTFDDIFILNLHGSAKLPKRLPDGSHDVNVFDIQQGVCIGIFVRRPRAPRVDAAPGNVHYAEILGSRESKYEWLSNHEVANTKWKRLSPVTPEYLFVPQDTTFLDEYDRGVRVTDIFPVNSVGIVTARDQLTVHWTPEETWETVKEFARISEEEARTEFHLAKDVRDWKVSLAQEDLRRTGPDRKFVTPLLYRPFDVRFTYYTGRSRGFLCMPRPEVMGHLLAGKGENLALITSRMTKGERFHHIQITNVPSEVICMSPKTSNNGFVFPLYLYPSWSGPDSPSDKRKPTVLSRSGAVRRKPNLNDAFVAKLEATTGLEFNPEGPVGTGTAFGPEDVLGYVVSILSSPRYRQRYEAFLARDFPRIPLPSDSTMFLDLALIGKRLVSQYLLSEEPELQTNVNYPIPGSNLVENGYPIYELRSVRKRGNSSDSSTGRVTINSSGGTGNSDPQFFDNVPVRVWEFSVGGYQVCKKWLKDRQGRTLSGGDLDTYMRVMGAISAIILLEERIDRRIAQWPIG